MGNLCLVTCNCYIITRFEYYDKLTKDVNVTVSTPTDKQPSSEPEQEAEPAPKDHVSITMVSHGDKNELRITDDKEDVTDIKREIIRAYRYAEKAYSDYHKKVTGKLPEFEFALECQVNPNEHHPITGDTGCPECCESEEAFKKLWGMWRQVLLETKET